VGKSGVRALTRVDRQYPLNADAAKRRACRKRRVLCLRALEQGCAGECRRAFLCPRRLLRIQAGFEYVRL
jgi:hypothetical protein